MVGEGDKYDIHKNQLTRRVAERTSYISQEPSVFYKELHDQSDYKIFGNIIFCFSYALFNIIINSTLHSIK
jgi:hypothetical protein